VLAVNDKSRFGDGMAGGKNDALEVSISDGWVRDGVASKTGELSPLLSLS
jgi:hypothetical protein